MVFCVISRYHGGAYVVFSRALNENLEVVALEGSYASVIGGAPAAAVVFAREVDTRTRKDPRLEELSQRMAQGDGAEKGRLRVLWNELFKRVHSEKLGEVAAEFDRVHCVERALRVGALNHILPPRDLRPFLIRALERGMEKVQQPRAEALAVRYAAAGGDNGDAELTIGGLHREAVPYWFKGGVAVRKPGPLHVTDSVANTMGRVRAPLSRPAKPVV